MYYHVRIRGMKDMVIINKKVYIVALIIVALVAMSLHLAWADEVNHVLQAYITEQTMNVFMDVKLNGDELRCSISNKSSEVISSGLLSDECVLIKTTVLIDVSTSIPSSMRDKVTTTIESLIEHKSKNEEFKLVVFGDEISTLQDFSSDRYDLSKAVEKIKFDGQQSKIYDAIYNNIPNLYPSDGELTFYRTIVISDGVDDTVSGITKEELFIKLQGQNYPVDIIAVSSNQDAENKELSAIVRMSGGRYYFLIPDTDIATLTQNLGVSGFFYTQIKVHGALLDGTTRQVDIADGIYNMSLDIKFPVFNPSNEIAPTETVEPEPSAKQEVRPITDEITEEKSNTAIFGNYSNLILIGAGIAFIILIVILAVVKSVRGKNKKTSLQNDSVITKYKRDVQPNKTEYIIDTNNAKSQYTIKLTNSNQPNKTWTLPVNKELIIGRSEDCTVRLDDKSVSREHCKIVAESLGVFVVHLSSTNKTSLNGSEVVGKTPLKSGDILKIGREILHIDYIQILGSLPPKEQPPKPHGGETESIF